jgi:alpha-beta hydrolase superfamily lysophospholipase
MNENQHQSKKTMKKHSMGGAIALLTARKRPYFFDGLVLSGPAVQRGSDINVFTLIIAQILSRVFPHLGVKALDPNSLSIDENVVKSYAQDPLVYHGKICARTGVELLKMFELIEVEASKFITFPLLICHGCDDKLTSPNGSLMVVRLAPTDDKTIKLYEGLRHEILNEPVHQQILEEMLKWIEERILRKRKCAAL